MRALLMTAAAVLTLWVPANAVAQAARNQSPSKAAQPDDEQGSTDTRAAVPDLAGAWRSAPFEVALNTDFDKSVWGPNAKSVRTVELTLRSSGEGVLTVTTRVLDARGRTVRGSLAIEEARLAVGNAQATVASRTEYAVKVVSAERRYPDDPGYKWQIDGLRVTLAALDTTGREIEIRVDTPEGRGSFWETLRRGRSTGAK